MASIAVQTLRFAGSCHSGRVEIENALTVLLEFRSDAGKMKQHADTWDGTRSAVGNSADTGPLDQA
jgi:hypothetical protein